MYEFIHIDGNKILQYQQIQSNKVLDYNDVHADILWLAHQYLSIGKSVVVSHTVLPAFYVLYQEYFSKYKIHADMTLLLPNFENILEKNKTIRPSFDEEFLEEMFALFVQEKSRNEHKYQYS
ncbi:MAG: hypothetical protein GXP45_06950 [bacterium]|nr:hypothetical protein [bacterium]